VKCEVYHTVESTEDKALIIKTAPFPCQDKPGELNEWLGDGYYFWEGSIKLAHWWGKVHYKRAGKHYAICRTFFHWEDGEILDLVGNTQQIKEVWKLVRQLKVNPYYDSSEFSAQFIINHIRKHAVKPFYYKAIRVYSEQCSGDKEVKDSKLFFDGHSYLNLCPEIQICVLDKTTLDLPMKLVYCSEEEDASSLTV